MKEKNEKNAAGAPWHNVGSEKDTVMPLTPTS